jgi:hypothetical protein
MSGEREYNFGAVAALAVSDAHEPRAVTNPPGSTQHRAQRVRPYLGGAPPLDWLVRAAQLPGCALQVAVALAYEFGILRSRELVPPRRVLGAMRVSKDAETRALRNLEQAGLILVSRKSGRRPRVALLWEPSPAEPRE